MLFVFCVLKSGPCLNCYYIIAQQIADKSVDRRNYKIVVAFYRFQLFILIIMLLLLLKY